MEPFETLQLPSYVKTVLEKLEQAGHRGYLVGGSLRDLLRGITPHDYDMTTDAVLAKVMWALPQTTTHADFCKLFLTPVGKDIH